MLVWWDLCNIKLAAVCVITASALFFVQKKLYPMITCFNSLNISTHKETQRADCKALDVEPKLYDMVLIFVQNYIFFLWHTTNLASTFSLSIKFTNLFFNVLFPKCGEIFQCSHILQQILICADWTDMVNGNNLQQSHSHLHCLHQMCQRSFQSKMLWRFVWSAAQTMCIQLIWLVICHMLSCSNTTLFFIPVEMYF